MLTVKAKATKNFIIFEIKIPLVARDNYELYRLIPIPQQIGYNMITLIPLSSHIVINIQKDSYLPMPENDIRNCQDIDLDYHLCPLTQPIHHMRAGENLCLKNLPTDQCQTLNVSCKESWTELTQLNTYIYFFCYRHTIRLMCENRITTEVLHKPGIITLGEGCLIKDSTYTIFSHKKRSNVFNQKADTLRIDIPSINEIFNTTIPTNPVESQNDSDDQSYFREIGKQLSELKKDNAGGILTGNITHHDVHQYTVLYLMVLCVAILSAVLLWRQRRRRPAPPPLPETGGYGGEAAAIELRPVGPACSTIRTISADMQCGECKCKNDQKQSNSDSVSDCVKGGSRLKNHKATSPRFFKQTYSSI